MLLSYNIWKEKHTNTMCCLNNSVQLLLSVAAKVKQPQEAEVALAAPNYTIRADKESNCGFPNTIQLRKPNNQKQQ